MYNLWSRHVDQGRYELLYCFISSSGLSCILLTAILNCCVSFCRLAMYLAMWDLRTIASVPVVLSCNWVGAANVSCSVGGGFAFNNKVTNTTTLAIHAANRSHVGWYHCDLVSRRAANLTGCNISLKLKGMIFLWKVQCFFEKYEHVGVHVCEFVYDLASAVV